MPSSNESPHCLLYGSSGQARPDSGAGCQRLAGRAAILQTPLLNLRKETNSDRLRRSSFEAISNSFARIAFEFRGSRVNVFPVSTVRAPFHEGAFELLPDLERHGWRKRIVDKVQPGEHRVKVGKAADYSGKECVPRLRQVGRTEFHQAAFYF